MKVNKGSLWIGRDWEDAITLSLSTVDCGVEPIYRYKNPDILLDDTKIIIGYQIYGFGNNGKYKTRIPKKFNNFVENLLTTNKNVKCV